MESPKRTRGQTKSEVNSSDEGKPASEVNGGSAPLESIENIQKEVDDGDPLADVESKPDAEEKIESKSRKRKANDSGPSGDESSTSISSSPRKDPAGEDGHESSSSMGLLLKQTLGKGKRARIPNKRYSDILLSPSPSPKAQSKTPVQNGDKTERIEAEPEMTSIEDPILITLKARSNTSSPSLSKRPKLIIDVNNPLYRKPFELGWKRELVYRGTFDNSMKRNGDIYYYTPAGKKVRSMREIAENIDTNELTPDNFTFFKEPLGLNDPEKEMIRDAKPMGRQAGVLKAKILSPKIRSPKVTPAKVPAKPSPKQTPKSTPKVTSPKVGSQNADTSGPKPRTRNVGNIKMKVTTPKGKSEKKAKVETEAMEVESGPTPSKRASTRKGSKVPVVKTAESPKSKKRANTNRGVNLLPAKSDDASKAADNHLQNFSYLYNSMLHVFQYLKVQDLLRAICACTLWRDIASHPLLWRTVRMKNSQVHSFEGLANSLCKHGTVHLDLRKMLLPNGGGDDIWPEFSSAIAKVSTLRKIELCRCPASVVEQLAMTNPNLEVINAVTIKCESMNLEQLSLLKNLKELRLKSTSTLSLSSDISALKELTGLKTLSLTSIKDLSKMDLSVIASLTDLESLDLGECVDFPKNFGDEILVKLTKLEKLRLEKGPSTCHTFEILEAVKSMPKLEQLELVNFDIKSGFDLALGACSNVKKLLIIPTYISQSATTNHMVLGGVLRLQSTLSHFVWGVTLELLRVTELFVDQCEDLDKKDKKEKKGSGNGDSIPVLKPVPCLGNDNDEIPPAHDPAQVEILPLPNLQKLLLQSLPTTRVKILKIPFHATWRQSITDTVS